MQRNLLLASLLIASCAGSLASAQEYLGEWDDPDGGAPFVGVPLGGTPAPDTVEVYVALNGSNANSGTASCPWQTITYAVSQMPAGRAYTINVEPGVYTEALETFPIRLPAHGIAVETWIENPNPMVPGGLAQIGPSAATAGTLDIFVVDSLGDEALPDTVFTGLELVSGRMGIWVNPVPVPSTQIPIDPVGVEVRGCRFENNLLDNIQLVTPPDWQSQYVVESNVIGGALCPSVISRSGINDYTYAGITSTLMRSNTIRNCDRGVWVYNNPGPVGEFLPEHSTPRIFSNSVQTCRINVDLFNCVSQVVNNTIAFATVPAGTGVVYTGTLELHNNILWNPLATELTAANPIVILNASNNNIGSTPPLFVGGDFPSTCVAKDLHLSPGSLMIDAGGNGRVLPVQGVAAGYAPFLMDVRTDVNMDVDLQPRIAAAPGGGVVDIGADEFNDVGLALNLPSGGTGAVLGTVASTVPGGNAYSFNVLQTGPPGGEWALFMGVGFPDTAAAGGITYANGALYQSVFVPLLGNLLIDVSPLYGTFVTQGTYGANGQALTPIAFTAQPAWMEGELYLQSFGRGSTPALSSTRLRIELDEARGVCGP